jgi:hypothetical protein
MPRTPTDARPPGLIGHDARCQQINKINKMGDGATAPGYTAREHRTHALARSREARIGQEN